MKFTLPSVILDNSVYFIFLIFPTCMFILNSPFIPKLYPSIFGLKTKLNLDEFSNLRFYSSLLFYTGFKLVNRYVCREETIYTDDNFARICRIIWFLSLLRLFFRFNFFSIRHIFINILYFYFS